MGNLNQFFRDLGRNAYGLGENVASLGSAAIAEPVAGFAAMYDPANGAQAIREGMTYTPRTQAGQMYQQGAARTLGAIAKPAMPVIETWQRGVDIAGGYSPMAGAMLRTVPAAIGVAMGAKPALQAGRQVSNSLGAMQARMIANANAPRTLNTGFRGQRGAVNVLNSVNPTGSVFVDYNPNQRASAPLAKNIVSYDKTSGGSPDELVTIYRGLPKNQKNINSGDFVTTNKRLAQDYAGDGHVIKMTVKKSELLDDINEPLGEEYIYRKPQRPLTEFEQAHLTAQQRAALPVNQGGLNLPADNTAMDRARAMGWDTQAKHVTAADIDAFDLSLASPTGKWGRAVYAATDDKKLPLLTAAVGKREGVDGLNVMPLMIRQPSPYDLLENGLPFGQASAEKMSALGYSGAVEPGAQAVFNPANIRSRFAAFDPFNRDSSNLLAQSAKFVPAATLGALMANEKRKEKRN